MNKQEAIEKIEKGKSNFNAWEDLVRNRAFEDALTIVRKIDEPEKPVVPQYVADWYEEHKDNFELSVKLLCVLGCEPVRKIDAWFDSDDNKPIVTLVKMKLFGYEVDKEKLYKVSLKKNGIGIGIQQQDGYIKDKLTETELSECGFDNLDVYEVKEVEE